MKYMYRPNTVSMQTWCLTSAETTRLIRDGGKGVEEGDYITVATLSITTRMTCVKMGSDESHFNVSLIVRVSK